LGKNLALTEAKVVMIKFLKRYTKLEEVSRRSRVYELGLTYHIKDSWSIINKRILNEA
jgi:cytochrome P450